MVGLTKNKKLEGKTKNTHWRDQVRTVIFWGTCRIVSQMDNAAICAIGLTRHHTGGQFLNNSG